MAEPKDLEGRVAALESTVRDLDARIRHTAQDAAAARVLAGGADRDVSETRQATTSSFNAMREDLTDLRQDLNDLRRHVDDGFARVDAGFAEMRGKFDATAAGLRQIVTLIDQQGGRQDQ